MTETKSSKSILPLVEIIISLIIFTIAAIITVQLFFLARFMGYKTQDRARAILEVQTIAEEIKSKDTYKEVQEVIQKYVQVSNGETGYCFVSKDWVAVEEKEAEFIIEINHSKLEMADGYLYNLDFNVYKVTPYAFVDAKYDGMNLYERPFLDTVNVKKFVKGSSTNE